MPPLDLTVDLPHLPAVQRALLEFPMDCNISMNRAFKAVGTNFSRLFSRTQLMGGSGIKIRRRARKNPTGPDKPSLPAKMRAAGFRGTITGLRNLNGKTMRIRSRSPNLYAHEFGANISAVKSRLGLAVRMQSSLDIPRKEMHGMIRRGELRAWVNKGKLMLFAPPRSRKKSWRGLAHYKNSVTLKARLRFYEMWAAYHPAAGARLDKAIAQVVKRFKLGSMSMGPEPGDYIGAGEGI